MSLYSARRSVSLDKTRGWYLGDTWITQQTALLNCARVGRARMLAGRAFQWMIVLGKNVPVIVFESGSVCMPVKGCVLMLWCFEKE